MTELLHETDALRERCDQARGAGLRVGLVPTMGALHVGHLSLVEAVRAAGADRVVVTIFVNPLQFAAGEDLERYPRTLASDLDLLRSLGVDIAFAPTPATVYPPDFQTHVEVTGITASLEGESRPTHFRGVTTVVAKLFNMVGPCVAAFGRKDYQQWRTLSRMVEDLNMPIEVLGCPIIREPDGLALSSRNRYLSAEDRKRALSLSAGLRAASERFAQGERNADALVKAARGPVDAHTDLVDYVALVDANSLVPVNGPCGPQAAVLIAAHVGSTRLIDNMILGQDAPPGE